MGVKVTDQAGRHAGSDPRASSGVLPFRRDDVPCAHPATSPVLAAPIHGFAAVVFAKVLEEHLPARMVGLERLAEQGRLHPGYLAEVAGQWAAVREAAAQWSRYRAAVDGSTEQQVTEKPRSSSEIDTAQAAELLGVSESRVRQQLRAGLLQGRKASRVWLVDRIDVELRQGAERDLLRRNAGPVPHARTQRGAGAGGRGRPVPVGG